MDDSDYVDMLAMFSAGDTVLHYRIIEPIGEGGMGEVYKASDLKLGRTVAIKVLPPRISNDPIARKRLLREARSASGLNQPNIVTIHAIEESEKCCFIVMEFVEGQSLSSMISKGALEIQDVTGIGTQIAQALATAHDAGLIHRDIKPENIMITRTGQVKLLDFGLAKRTIEGANSITNLSQSGAISGTICYMSPEQTHGQPLDLRTDIFSLGCVLYRASTGIPPFDGASALDILNAINSFDPPLPSSISTRLPQEFDLIISRCLAKDRERRYSSAHELAAALEKLKAMLPAKISGSVSAHSAKEIVRPKTYPPKARTNSQPAVITSRSLPAREPQGMKLAMMILVAFVAGAGLIYMFKNKSDSGDAPPAEGLKVSQQTAPPSPAVTTVAPQRTVNISITPPAPIQASPAPEQQSSAPNPEPSPPQRQQHPSPESLPPEQQEDHFTPPPQDRPERTGGIRGGEPHPPFFPRRPGIILIGTTWHMALNGHDIYFHFTPERNLYVKAPFMTRSGICGTYQQNRESVTANLCEGSTWEGTREGDRIRWTIRSSDGSVQDDVYSEMADSPVDW